MEKPIFIYAPNISKENLQGLFYLQAGCLGDKVSLDWVKRKTKFRSPELSVFGEKLTEAELARVFVHIFEVATLLGGTRFVFLKKGKTLGQIEGNEKPEKVLRVTEDMSHSNIDKIEIY